MKILLVHTPFDWKRPITTLPHLIRKVAGVFNNHGSFLIDGYIYESDINGVVKVPIREWAKNQTITVYDCNEYYAERVAKNIVGKHRYDFMSLFIYQPIYLATGWYVGREKRKAENRMYCFEYLSYCLGQHKWYKVTPKEFNEYCDRNFKKTHANINIQDYIKDQGL